MTGAGSTGNGAKGAGWVGGIRVVAPTVLLASLVRMSVTVEVQLKRRDKGQEGNCLQSRLLAGTCTNTLPPPQQTFVLRPLTGCHP